MARHKRQPRVRPWQRMAAVLLLAAMPVGGFAAWKSTPMGSTPAGTAARTQTTATTGKRTATTETAAKVSRSSQREPLTAASPTVDGTWLESDTIDTAQLTAIPASNKTVRAWVNGPDKNLIPIVFQPDHATGDTGLAYAFSQCTWWAYTRRHQLGLPVGSHLGNGAQWADRARALGYWVDNTPRHEGDIIVFQRGQYGSSPVYGHVAIVEHINADGSIVTSECGASLAGRPVSRTFSRADAATLQYIHY